MELAALERLKNQCHHVISVDIDPIFFKLAGNKDMHNIMNEFEFRPDRTTDYGVSCPWASKKYPYRPYNGKNGVSTFSLLFLIGSFWYFHVTRTSIKTWMSLNFLKWDLTLAHWTQVSDRCPLGYLYLFGQGVPNESKGGINLKHATNGHSDKGFLLTSKVCPQGVVCPCPGTIYMYKIIKNVYKIRFRRDHFETCNIWAKRWPFCCHQNFVPNVLSAPARRYIHVEKRV